MITTGEGGMILFKKKSHYEKAKILRDHGMSKTKKYYHVEVGFNLRMTNIQAAIELLNFLVLRNFYIKENLIIKNFIVS